MLDQLVRRGRVNSPSLGVFNESKSFLKDLLSLQCELLIHAQELTV